MNNLLKFITCGSVDDGKSTLIGHILYDAKLLYADQEKSLQLDSKIGSRGGAIDYSLLLDGLMAEREQGITIDVAYRYFTTNNRSFIVADTPGHEEYTRNMAVGASFADLSVILVDASQGVLIQTKRHARICALMGIHHFVFAVNKMDLIDYDEDKFRAIEAEIKKLSKELGLHNVKIIPVSATEGDNVTKKSKNIPWYKEESLLTYLENVDVSSTNEEQGFYLPVQRVCRPNHEFRGFQGQIEAGSVKTGDLITALPSKEQAHVKNILVGDKPAEEAYAGQAVTIQLDREMDVSRGCVLSVDADLQISSSLTVTLLWMDDDPLTSGKNFYVKIGTRQIPGVVTKIHYAINVNTGEKKSIDTLNKNEIAVCALSLSDDIVVDEFLKHKTLGELILIDRVNHMTSACGVVTYVKKAENVHRNITVTRQIRAELKGQAPIVIGYPLDNRNITREFVEKVERHLADIGRHTYLYAPQPGEDYETIIRHLIDAGLLVLLLLDEKIVIPEELQKENYYYLWNRENGADLEKAVDFAKKHSSFSAYISGNGDYNI